MIQSFLMAASKIINRYLHLDPESEIRLQKLNGKVISIELKPLNLLFFCHFNEKGVNLTSQHDEIPNATIAGTPLQLLSAMVNKKERQTFFSDDLKITGDLELANQMVQLFDEMHVDLEHEISKIVGDTAAYHVSNFMQQTKKWWRTTVDAFSEDVNEYTHEEAKLFPTHEQLSNFYDEIDELRMATDRLESRMNLLKSKNKNVDPATSEDESQ